MFLLIVAWVLLVLIGLFDARDNRIPNALVLLLAVVGISYQAIVYGSITGAFLSITCGIVVFCCALVFYFLKVMAPGDVKLMGAVGCLVSWSEIGASITWIALATVLVGGFYIAYFKSQLSSTTQIRAHSPAVNSSSKTLSNDRLLMPFAPVVVIGLALSGYFN